MTNGAEDQYSIYFGQDYTETPDIEGEEEDVLSNIYRITQLSDVRRIVTDYSFEVFDRSFRLQYPDTDIHVADIVNVVFIFRSMMTRTDAMRMGVSVFHHVDLN